MRRPDSAGTLPDRQRTAALLPERGGPHSARISPSSSVKERASTSVIPPTRHVRPTTSRIFTRDSSCGPPVRGGSGRLYRRDPPVDDAHDVAAHLPAVREQEVRPETHHGRILARARWLC